MLQLITNLKPITNFDTYGSYKDLSREMYCFNIDEVEIFETRYCFKLVENKRILSYKEVLELSDVDNLEKINYQNKVSRGDYIED